MLSRVIAHVTNAKNDTVPATDLEKNATNSATAQIAKIA